MTTATKSPKSFLKVTRLTFLNLEIGITVQRGILTVADDLLENDGKKFIKIMKQLAKRQMTREEDAKKQFSTPNYDYPTNGSMYPHFSSQSHPAPPDDEEDNGEDEEEDEFDSQDEDYDDEEMVCGGLLVYNMF